MMSNDKMHIRTTCYLLALALAQRLLHLPMRLKSLYHTLIKPRKFRQYPHNRTHNSRMTKNQRYIDRYISLTYMLYLSSLL